MSEARAPRPFYVIAHHCNRVEQVQLALDHGANAIECDVSWDEALWIRHPSNLLEPLPDATPLTDYLASVRDVAERFDKRFALAIFDLKPSMTEDSVRWLLDEVRRILTESTSLNVIFSVADFERRGVLEPVLASLLSREGAGIDEHDQPEHVAQHFAAKGVRNVAYGNGIHTYVPDLIGGSIELSIRRALQIKHDTGQIQFVCRWTLNDPSSMQRYIELGVDGIMTDDVERLASVTETAEAAVRLASRADNPFQSSFAAA
jgi:glycerophosphoryl diester phosphodiesterase